MFTPSNFLLIKNALEISKDKIKFLESFGIPLIDKAFSFSDIYQHSFDVWMLQQKKIYIKEIKKEEEELTKKLEITKKRRCEYE
jgi:hypothetical protein